MSALSSGSFGGAEAFYKAIPPRQGDLGGPFVGACYIQKHDICWIPDRGSTIWVVTAVQLDKVILQPNAGGPNRPRWQRQQRLLPFEILNTEYKRCRQQRQYPPC